MSRRRPKRLDDAYEAWARTLAAEDELPDLLREIHRRRVQIRLADGVLYLRLAPARRTMKQDEIDVAMGPAPRARRKPLVK